MAEALPRQIYVLFGADERERTRVHRRAVRATSARQGWNVTEFPCRRVASQRGRKLSVLSRGDAANLYFGLHHVHSAVVVLTPAVVRTDPARQKVRDDRVVGIDDFCRYKAWLTRRGDDGRLPADWANQFEAWCATPGVEDHRDARCFPFFSFSAGVEAKWLDSEAGRAAFDRRHGRHPNRRDERKRGWQAANSGSRHGRDPVAVAGRVLVLGFHWDVQPTYGDTRLPAPNQVWRIRQRGYANVYPDGYVRGGHGCHLLWTHDQSEELDQRER